MPPERYDTLDQKDLLPGDLLLGFSADLKGTDDEFKSGYAHVAIEGINGEIFEASSSGVQKTDVKTLLETYGHIAVIRAENTWSVDRVRQLDDFLQSQVGKPFNSTGMYRVPKKKEKLRTESMKRVYGYFEGTESPPPAKRNRYFCSELVTSAFIDAEIIHKSAAILLSPDVFSPEAIAKDKVFGLFKGYIVPYDSYRVPVDDRFRNSI